MLTLKLDKFTDSKAAVWVNPVNCHGVPGKGLSSTLSELFPRAFVHLRERARENALEIGVVSSYLLLHDNPSALLHFPIRRHWRSKATLENIELGLQAVCREVVWLNAVMGIEAHSLAIPALGCENGELDWGDVYALYQKVLEPKTRASGLLSDISVEVYEPENSV